jgi:hypothetical protein
MAISSATCGSARCLAAASSCVCCGLCHIVGGGCLYQGMAANMLCGTVLVAALFGTYAA